MYSFGADYTHIAVPRGEAPLVALREMQRVLEGTEDLIAIYIPKAPSNTTTHRIGSTGALSPWCALPRCRRAGRKKIMVIPIGTAPIAGHTAGPYRR